MTETPYLRLGRECPEYAWWRLPVGLVTGFGIYLAVTIGAVLATLAVFFTSTPSDDVLDAFLASDLSTSNPWVLGLMLLSVAVWLPCQLFGRFVCGPRVGDLMSVEGRVRWRWLWTCALLAFALYGGAIGLAAALDDDPSPISIDGDAVLVMVVALLIVPVQATAEEVVFRGQLMQMVGAWTRWAWVPVVVSTPLFVAGHAYDFWGLVDVGIFGLTAALLTIRTGGLEAAMAAHTANNVVLFVIESAGLYARTDADYGPVDLLPTVVVSVLMMLAVEVAFRRSGLRRTRDRLPDPPPRVQPVPYPYAQPVPSPYAQSTQPQAAPGYAPVPTHPPPAYAPVPTYPPPSAHAPLPTYAPPPAAAPTPRRTDYPPYPGEISDDWG